MSKLTKIEGGAGVAPTQEEVLAEREAQLERERVRLMQTIDRAEHHLGQLAERMDKLLREVDAGNLEHVPEIMKRSKEMRDWLRMATELEVKREIRRRDEDGRAKRAVDLERARAQIGCRLARLRATRCPGRIPE